MQYDRKSYSAVEAFKVVTCRTISGLESHQLQKTCQSGRAGAILKSGYLALSTFLESHLLVCQCTIRLLKLHSRSTYLPKRHSYENISRETRAGKPTLPLRIAAGRFQTKSLHERLSGNLKRGPEKLQTEHKIVPGVLCKKSLWSVLMLCFQFLTIAPSQLQKA